MTSLKKKLVMHIPLLKAGGSIQDEVLAKRGDS